LRNMKTRWCAHPMVCLLSLACSYQFLSSYICMRFLTRCVQPVVCLLPCLFLPVLSSDINWGSWQDVYGWFPPLLVSLLTSFCACTLHDAPYCWFSMNQRICGEGWIVFGVLELLRFKPILSKGFLKLLAALQCYWW
jgi:hypothetical protein